jgi:hypothetical protein
MYNCCLKDEEGGGRRKADERCQEIDRLKAGNAGEKTHMRAHASESLGERERRRVRDAARRPRVRQDRPQKKTSESASGMGELLGCLSRLSPHANAADPLSRAHGTSTRRRAVLETNGERAWPGTSDGDEFFLITHGECAQSGSLPRRLFFLFARLKPRG